MNNDSIPFFPGITRPNEDFAGLLDNRRLRILVEEIDLSTARSFAANTAIQKKMAGTSFFVDQAPDVGTAYIIFEGQQDDANFQIMPAMYVQPGFKINQPFANIRIANAAQANKKLRIFYGTDIDFFPANPATVNAVPSGLTYGASYKSVTLLGANGSENIFTNLQNANGAIVFDAFGYTSNAGIGIVGFLAKVGAAAPANLVDGDCLNVYAAQAAGGLSTPLHMPNPVYVPAGRGLWALSVVAETTAYRSCIYTLL